VTVERSGRLVTAGRVGRSHGLDGSFRVLAPAHGLARGTAVSVAGTWYEVRARRGTDDQPIVALDGLRTREAVRELGGELILVSDDDSPIAEGEWLAEDLVGCRIAGLGTVVGVMDGPSCAVLELSEGALVPLVADAVRAVDTEAGTIDVDRAFLGLDPPAQ
jgi:16S rRNA processing protein RimM